MKTILATLLLSLAALVASGDDTFTIIVENSTEIISGPFTSQRPVASTQHAVTLNGDQLNAVNAIRVAHPGAVITFDGNIFALHPIEVIREALITEFAALSPGEQALYKPAYDGVKAMLAAGNLTEAQKIIFLSPVPTDDLAAARTRMLALFPAQ